MDQWNVFSIDIDPPQPVRRGSAIGRDGASSSVFDPKGGVGCSCVVQDDIVRIDASTESQITQLRSGEAVLPIAYLKVQRVTIVALKIIIALTTMEIVRTVAAVQNIVAIFTTQYIITRVTIERVVTAAPFNQIITTAAVERVGSATTNNPVVASGPKNITGKTYQAHDGTIGKLQKIEAGCQLQGGELKEEFDNPAV